MIPASSPPTPLAGPCIGIDLGGTKIEVVALAPASAPGGYPSGALALALASGSTDVGGGAVPAAGTTPAAGAIPASGTMLWRLRRPTPQGDYEGTLATIVDLVRECEAHAGAARSVGIGTPGAVSRASGRIKNSNSVVLNGRPLREDLESALGCPVRMSNDANCFALSEAVDGAGAGVPVVFGVILGTGVGGGIVVDGRVLGGCNGIAGEWGHNRLPHGTNAIPRPCYCGRSDCVETYLSGPALERDHALVTGEQRSCARIALGADQGDAACRASLYRYADRLAAALAQVVNILDPDVIVLGGGVSNIRALPAMVMERWGPWVFSDRIDTRVLGNRHGDSSGVRGAAWLGAQVP